MSPPEASASGLAGEAPGRALEPALEDVELGLPALRGARDLVRAGLEADLAFCHPAIRAVLAVDTEAGRLVLRVTRGAATAAELRAQVAQVVDLSIASYRFVPESPPLWQRSAGAQGPGGRRALAAFGERFLRPLGPGQWALVGPAARLRQALDDRFARLALDAGAEPWHLPSIEMADDLIPKVGYFASHGQYVTWGVHLTPRFDALRRFSTDARAQALAFPGGDHPVEPTGFILEPMVCHNVYRALRGARLRGPRTITALGAAYRYEGFRFEALLRQWEFSMREAVLCGSAGEVDGQRRRLLAGTQALCDELDLDATLEIATDPFFVSEAGSARAFQAMQSTKLELRLGLGDGGATAAASFNLHGTHFTEVMDIRAGGDGGPLCETACVAWGLERWMAAFVVRWGADADAWPLAIKAPYEPLS